MADIEETNDLLLVRKMIKPTIGRIVWFTPSNIATFVNSRGDQPLAAIVTYVWDDRMVNLTVFDHQSVSHGMTSVKLVQDDEERPSSGHYCEWMPYQKGQAAKTETLEANLELSERLRGTWQST